MDATMNLEWYSPWTYPFSQTICVFCEQCRINNAPLMFGLLEMWIRVKEAYFRELSLLKEVRQIFHCISSQACNVLILIWMQFSQCINTIHHIIRHFNTNLKANGIFVGKEFAQCHQETTITATNISKFNLVISNIWV